MMQGVLEVVYWSSLGLVVYTYAMYPALIYTLSRLCRRDSRIGNELLSVTIVIAVRNEEQRVGRKLDSLLELDYPADKMNIVVVSDGSTDRTDDIVQGFDDRNVRLERIESEAGKAPALNRGVSSAGGELVVFCDVRQHVDVGAVRALVAPFADPSIGAVSGELHTGSDRGPGIYWRYEKFIRIAESRFSSAVGATGHLYAIRRNLFRALPKYLLLDDVYTPMQIVLQGYRVLFEPAAKVFDEEASIKAEFLRKARTLAGNFQLLHQLPGVLNPGRNPIFVQFISHKVLRLVCPYAFIMLFISNVWLLVSGSSAPVYGFSFSVQVFIYSLAVKGILGNGSGWQLTRIFHTFVVFNAAAIEGLRRYLRGDFRWH